LPATFSSDPQRLNRFELGARATAALKHPNILAAHDIGTHDAPYIASSCSKARRYVNDRPSRTFSVAHGSAAPVASPFRKEVAGILSVSRSTSTREWRTARARMHRRLTERAGGTL
jgi:hypothetical protein